MNRAHWLETCCYSLINKRISGRFRSALSMRDELCNSALMLFRGWDADGIFPEPVFRVEVRPNRAGRFERAGNPDGAQARLDSAEFWSFRQLRTEDPTWSSARA